VDVDALPASDTLRAAFDADARRSLQATGGDDYELCFTAPVDARDAIDAVALDTGVAARRIGVVTATQGVTARTRDGAWSAPAAGWLHFS
jgi:thiamine-monophosphate kinase